MFDLTDLFLHIAYHRHPERNVGDEVWISSKREIENGDPVLTKVVKIRTNKLGTKEYKVECKSYYMDAIDLFNTKEDFINAKKNAGF